MNRHIKKTTTLKWPVLLAKTQISLDIWPVWSMSSLSAWRSIGSLATQLTHSEDSDQTGRMARWSESSLGAQVIWLVLSCCGVYDNIVAHLADPYYYNGIENEENAVSCDRVCEIRKPPSVPYCVCEQRSIDFADAHARSIFRCSPIWYVTFSHSPTHLFIYLFILNLTETHRSMENTLLTISTIIW